MDRIQFIDNIRHNDENNINIIKDFFEQYMLLYDLTEKNAYNVTIMSIDNINGEFKLEFKTEEEANSIINNFRPTMTAYNKLFSISYTKIDLLNLIIYIKQVS